MPAPSYSPTFFATATISGIVSTSAQQFSGAKQFLSVLGLAKYATGSLPTPSLSIEGYVAYDDTTNEVKYCNGLAWVSVGGAMPIGGSVSGGTVGSVLFVGAGSVLAEDNANFFWDDTNNRLGLGTASPLYKLQIDHSATSRAQFGGSTFGSNLAVMSRHGSLPYGGAVGFSTNLDTQAIVLSNDAFPLLFLSQSLSNIRDNTPIGATTGLNGATTISTLHNGGRWEHTPANAGFIETLTDDLAYGAKYEFTIARNSTLPHTNSVLALKPTFNQGGSNSNQTINIFDIDTVNTATTGTTINLASLSYGGTERFAVAANGEVRFNGSAGTVGYVLQSSGAGSPPTWVSAGGGSAYNVIQEEGSSLTARTILNFIGSGVTAVDNGGSTRTDVTVHTASASQEGTVSTGTQTFAGNKTFTGSTTFTTGGSVFNSTNQELAAFTVLGVGSGRVMYSTRTSDGNYGRLSVRGRSTAGVAIGATGAGASSLQYVGTLTFYNQTIAELDTATPASAGTSVLSIDASGNVVIGTDKLVVDATNSRVGIGTASPTRTLDIRTSGTATPVQIMATSTSGFSGLVYTDTAGTAKASTGYGQSATASPFTSSYYFNASSGVDTVWLTNSTERLRMASGGNFTFGGVNVTFDTNTLHVDATNNRVGIGTTSPSSALHSTGLITAGAGINSGGNIALTGEFDILPSADDTGDIGTDSLRWRRVRATTVVTGASLVFDNHIRPNASDYVVEVRKADNATVVASFDTVNGRVGIGTNTPTAALDIVGNIVTSGSITATNIAGTNTDDVTLNAVGSSPNANGASLSGQSLTLQPADGSNPGLLTAGTQTIGGAKTFSGDTTISTYLILGTQKIGSGSAAPVVGTWNQGDIIFNNAGTSGAHAGWYCVASGTPGTWKQMGLISE